MAGPAKRLKAVRVVGVLARLALQRRDVIHLKPSGPPALDAPEVVALEDGAAYGCPSAGLKADVVSAQILLARNQF